MFFNVFKLFVVKFGIIFEVIFVVIGIIFGKVFVFNVVVSCFVGY